MNQPAAGSWSVHLEQGTLSLGDTCCSMEASLVTVTSVRAGLWPHSFRLTGLTVPWIHGRKVWALRPKSPQMPKMTPCSVFIFKGFMHSVSQEFLTHTSRPPPSPSLNPEGPTSSTRVT